MSDQSIGAVPSQALARGLGVLQVLVEEGTPLRATEIARRFGVHQSSISRVMTTLTTLGYVRKDADGLFVPDYQLLALSSATSYFPLIQLPRRAVQDVADRHPGAVAALSIMWRGRLIYLLRAIAGTEILELGRPRFPLHLSAPGLRLLVDLPDEQALPPLRESRAKLGWDGVVGVVPSTEADVLAAVRALVEHDTLILDGWHTDGGIGGAIPVKTPEALPVVLSLSGGAGLTDAATLRLWLHDGRRTVEESMTQPASSPSRGRRSA